MVENGTRRTLQAKAPPQPPPHGLNVVSGAIVQFRVSGAIPAYGVHRIAEEGLTGRRIMGNSSIACVFFTEEVALRAVSLVR